MSRLKKIRYSVHDKTRHFSSDSRSRGDERTDFERDRSRIIHSAAFRRLQGKTQVFTAGEGDFFRTRLTHTLEVAQISKGIALRLKADTDLLEAIALVHDIGHPPFGHAGEEELKRLMRPYGGFEANAQNIRILTKLEIKSDKYQGLNLTRAVIDGQMKYKNEYSDDDRKFVYQGDVNLVEWAAEEARNTVGVPDSCCRSFECEIMDWADKVAYAVHDLEDSIRAGYIDRSTFYDPLPKQILAEVGEKYKHESIDVSRVYEELIAIIRKENSELRPTPFSESERQLKAARKRLTSVLISRYIRAGKRVLRPGARAGKLSERYLWTLIVPLSLQIEVSIINEFIRKFVIEAPQICALEEKGKHIVGCLFRKFVHEDNARQLLPRSWQSAVPAGSARALRARVVSDYIAGMTDNYAQKTFAKLFLPNQGSIYDVL